MGHFGFIWLVFDLYLKIIKTFAIFFQSITLFVLFKRSIIIFTFLFFLINRTFKIVIRSYCSCLFREGQNSTYVPSVWRNVHDCTSLLVQRQQQFWGNFVWQLAAILCRQAVNDGDGVPSPKNCQLLQHCIVLSSCAA